MTGNGRKFGEDLWVEFRKGTRQSAPARLAGMVRARLPRAPGILPGAVAACLVSSILLSAITTFLLILPKSPPLERPGDPPPVFGDTQGDLFLHTARVDSP